MTGRVLSSPALELSVIQVYNLWIKPPFDYCLYCQARDRSKSWIKTVVIKDIFEERWIKSAMVNPGDWQVDRRGG